MSEVKKHDSVVVQIEGRLHNKAIFVPVYVESEEYNGSFDAWAPSGHLRSYHTSQIVYFAKSMVDAEAWAEEHKGLTVEEFKKSISSSEDTISAKTSIKYYGLFEYLPGSPEDGMSADSFDLLEVVEAPSEEAAVKMLNPSADDDSQFVRELTKDDYELYGVDLTYPLDPSKISAAFGVWPEELTYDEYEEGDQIIDAFIEVIDDLGFFEEPSAQGGVGSDFIYDENDNLILEIDLQEEQDILTDFYYSSSSRDDFKKKIADWLSSYKVD